MRAPVILFCVLYYIHFIYFVVTSLASDTSSMSIMFLHISTIVCPILNCICYYLAHQIRHPHYIPHALLLLHHGCVYFPRYCCSASFCLLYYLLIQVLVSACRGLTCSWSYCPSAALSYLFCPHILIFPILVFCTCPPAPSKALPFPCTHSRTIAYPLLNLQLFYPSRWAPPWVLWYNAPSLILIPAIMN